MHVVEVSTYQYFLSEPRICRTQVDKAYVTTQQEMRAPFARTTVKHVAYPFTGSNMLLATPAPLLQMAFCWGSLKPVCEAPCRLAWVVKGGAHYRVDGLYFEKLLDPVALV